MKFAADSVTGLPGEFGHLVVPQLLVRHEQEEQAVLLREAIQCLLDPLAKLSRFEAS